ncbi:unnamed protein product [Haemonchus placei]|uniref:Uncharacterized protein n=1 Tax=Haemonchus placei TaxID=6290 RepID=A0A0N4W5C3_HAEPC|nr:unnamed protein product [Haemonchus placei]
MSSKPLQNFPKVFKRDPFHTLDPCSPSHLANDMALSVLEKKFDDLEPLARSHSSGIEDGIANNDLSEVGVYYSRLTLRFS